MTEQLRRRSESDSYAERPATREEAEAMRDLLLKHADEFEQAGFTSMAERSRGQAQVCEEYLSGDLAHYAPPEKAR